MRIISLDGQSPFPDSIQTVTALGNFDGMHKGHQHVLYSAGTVASALNAPLAALTFEPHPVSIFFPDHPPFRLTNPKQKAACMASLGVQFLYVVPFTPDFAQLSAEHFIEAVLIEQLRVRHVVTGYDFIFGHKRQGNTSLLEHYAAKQAFGFTSVPALTIPDQPNIAYSSTRIRQCIKEGKVQDVPPLMGRHFSIAGIVITGKQQGRTLGFPTANLLLGDFIHPMFGVYAVQVTLDGHVYPGIANIGCKPTFGASSPLLEVHLFDFDEMLYDRYIEVAFIQFLRAEKPFPNIQALRTQITTDCLHARQLLGML